MGREAQVKVAITAEDLASAAINSVERELTHLGGTVAGLGSVLSSLGGGMALAGIGAGLKSLIDYEASIGRASKATGMTAEQMSGLAFAVQNTDLPLETLVSGLTKFDKVISGLARGGAGAKAVKDLGLSISDLLKMSPHEALLKIADAFQKHAEGAQKAADASALFGGAGKAMLPFLDEGAAGIMRLEALAAQLGVTLSQDDVDSAEQAKQAMVAFGGALQGAEMAAARGLIPTLTGLTKLLAGDYNEWMILSDSIEMAVLKFDKWILAVSSLGLATKGMKELDDQFKKVSQHQTDLMTAASVAPAEGMGTSAGKGTGSGKGSRTGTDSALAERMRVAAEKQRELSAGMREYAQLLDSLLPTEGAFDKATKEYATTLDRINQLELKGVDVTLAKAEALRRLNEQLAAARDKAMQSGDWASGYKALGLGSENEPGKQNAPAPMDKFFQMMEYGDLKDSQAQMEKMGELGKKFGDEMSGGFAQMIVYGRGFTDMLRGALDMLIKLVLEALVFQPLADMFGGSGGGFLGGLFSGLGGHAGGGDVSAGVPSIVGELGPELFVPSGSGSIIPNGKFGGGGVTVINNIDARGADAFADKRLLLALQMTKQAAVTQAVSQAREAKLRSAG